MKTINLLKRTFFLLSLALISSCASSQSFMPIRGTGSPVDHKVNVSGFHAIDVSSGFDVVLVQGNDEGLVLTAQENLFDHVVAEVNQGVLKIYMDRNVIESKGLKARISFKSIDNLKVSGGGDISSETPINVSDLTLSLSGGGDISTTIHTGNFQCNISGGGDANFNGSADSYNVNMSGGGDLKSDISARHIFCSLTGGGDATCRVKDKTDDAKIDISGGGDISLDINATKLQCSLSGGGDAKLSGSATNFDVNINGGGDVNAGNLATSVTSFKASGGSDMHLNASQEITGYISGGGDVYYSGNPDVVNVDAKGGSKVHKE